MSRAPQTGGEPRTGTIVETSEHDRQRFFRLELEQ
jgi:hypothetical protein